MAWFHSFFDREYVEILRAKRPRRITRQEVAVLARALRIRPGMSVLDAPCGFGRHALEFARRGCRVVGVDLSPAMLAVRNKHARIKYVRMDLRRLAFKNTFDAIFCSSSGYFSDRQNLALLKRMARALKPGGRLALWTFSTQARAKDPKGRRWSRVGHRYILEDYAYDAGSGIYKSDWIIWRPGLKEPFYKHVHVRGYEKKEWRAMIRNAGLRLEKVGPKPDLDKDGGGLQLVAVKSA